MRPYFKIMLLSDWFLALCMYQIILLISHVEGGNWSVRRKSKRPLIVSVCPDTHRAPPDERRPERENLRGQRPDAPCFPLKYYRQPTSRAVKRTRVVSLDETHATSYVYAYSNRPRNLVFVELCINLHLKSLRCVCD